MHGNIQQTALDRSVIHRVECLIDFAQTAVALVLDDRLDALWICQQRTLAMWVTRSQTLLWGYWVAMRRMKGGHKGAPANFH